MRSRKRFEHLAHLEFRTAHLSLAEHGAYAILSQHFCRDQGYHGWTEELLCRVCRAISGDEQDAVQSILRQFFDQDENGYWHPSNVEAARETISRARRIAIIERDGAICTYCGDEAGPFHIDHVHPVSRGGSNDPDNLVVACKTCNLAKGALLPEEWQGGA